MILSNAGACLIFYAKKSNKSVFAGASFEPNGPSRGERGFLTEGRFFYMFLEGLVVLSALSNRSTSSKEDIF